MPHLTKAQRIEALEFLAFRDPRRRDVGYMWRSPIHPKSSTMRWTADDLALYRKFQALARKFKSRSRSTSRSKSRSTSRRRHRK